MDVKSGIIGLCLALNAYLLYVNQRHEGVLMNMSAFYQTALAQKGAPSGAPIAEAGLANAIRDAVKAELAGRPGTDCGSRAGSNDGARLQDLQVKLNEFDKKVSAALVRLMEPESQEDARIFAKAKVLKNKIIALCKK